ncbi:uncharacterized protein ARMOST_07694 [Armillaria ostoyae]|uniref:Uncharacterized protein n=1 Tax=Armillaria ostoyae TaxID=47428 RepID=A0A284R6I2_ARMOS|nr:uncharacterized protein ARMOST_07694 [Armillaria ostoyae]
MAAIILFMSLNSIEILDFMFSSNLDEELPRC